MNTKFSVVIPLYNKANYILECLESVYSQSVQAAQIIVVDDGSTDCGSEIVRKHFPDVQLVSQANQGAAIARNTGVGAATMPWVAFLDADDLWLPFHLEELNRVIFESPETHLVANQYVESKHPNIGAVHSSEQSRRTVVNYFTESLSRRVVWTSSAAVKRESILLLGGFRPFRTGEDSDLWARMALKYPVGISEKVTAIYRRGVDGLMAQEAMVRDKAARGELPSPRTYDDLVKEQATIVGAIRAGSPMASPEQLTAYLDFLLLKTVKERLARADTSGARAYMRLVKRRFSLKYLTFLGLSFVPSQLLWAMLQAKRKKTLA